MAIRLRPAVVTAGFAALFAVIADLAWATAITTTGPWFSGTVSLVVYATALVLAAVLSVVLVHQATARVAQLTASLIRLERRVVMLRAARTPREGASLPPAVGDSGPEVLEARDSPVLLRLEREGHDTLVPLPQEARTMTGAARTELLRQLLRERTAIREARARVWSTAAGPVLASVLFLAIAGPMLPGAEGFAAAHYALNTTLVLFLSYGFAPLVAWSLLALGLMGSPGGRGSA